MTVMGKHAGPRRMSIVALQSRSSVDLDQAIGRSDVNRAGNYRSDGVDQHPRKNMNRVYLRANSQDLTTA